MYVHICRPEASASRPQTGAKGALSREATDRGLAEAETDRMSRFTLNDLVSDSSLNQNGGCIAQLVKV